MKTTFTPSHPLPCYRYANRIERSKIIFKITNIAIPIFPIFWNSMIWVIYEPSLLLSKSSHFHIIHIICLRKVFCKKLMKTDSVTERKPMLLMPQCKNVKTWESLKRTTTTIRLISYQINWYINPFHVIGLFPYPLKISENQRFSDVFRRYRKRPWTWNGLIHFRSIFLFYTFWKYQKFYNLFMFLGAIERE